MVVARDRVDPEVRPEVETFEPPFAGIAEGSRRDRGLSWVFQYRVRRKKGAASTTEVAASRAKVTRLRRKARWMVDGRWGMPRGRARVFGCLG